jgi:hypothetical protein
MTDQKSKLIKALEKELNNDEKRLLQLMRFENRKDKIVVRMPAGLFSLESLWLRVVEISAAHNTIVCKADTFATVAELDDVLGNVEWLWKYWLPKGLLTILAGMPDAGKTMIAIDWLRIVTTGASFYNCEPLGAPANSVWIDAESGQQILRERVHWLKADKYRVFLPVIDGNILCQPDFSNSDHKQEIANLIAAKKPELLVLDSLGGGNQRGENKVEDVRPIMQYFSQIAQEFNMATVILHHLNKGAIGESTEISLSRIRGSTEITAAARSIIGLEPGKSKGEIKFRHVKGNAAPKQEPFAVNMIVNENQVTGIRYSDYVAPPEKKTKREKCAEWVTKELECSIEPYPLKDLLDKAEPLGYSRMTIYSAKDMLGDSITVSGSGRQAFWQLTNNTDGDSVSNILDAMIMEKAE